MLLYTSSNFLKLDFEHSECHLNFFWGGPSLKSFEAVHFIDQLNPFKAYFQALLGQVSSHTAKAWMAILGFLLNTLVVHESFPL